MNKAETVKLEVFSLILNPIEQSDSLNTFEDLYSKKSNINNRSSKFAQFSKLFISHIDLKYTQIRNKAFTLSTNKADYGIDLTNECIWGILKGGSKGDGKTKSSLSDRNKEDDLSGNVINDKFFFMINLPKDSNKGYLFFQVYGNESIRSEFIQHISNLFKVHAQYLKPHCNPILPNMIRDEFKKHTKIVGLTYNTNMLSSAMTTDTKFTNLAADYNIEITIKPKGNVAIPADKVKIIEKVLSTLKLNDKPLQNSRKKKVSVANVDSKKTSTFELDVNDVMPRIYLKGRVAIDANGTPNFIELKDFCDKLLEELTLQEYTRIIRNP